MESESMEENRNQKLYPILRVSHTTHTMGDNLSVGNVIHYKKKMIHMHQSVVTSHLSHGQPIELRNQLSKLEQYCLISKMHIDIDRLKLLLTINSCCKPVSSNDSHETKPH